MRYLILLPLLLQISYQTASAEGIDQKQLEDYSYTAGCMNLEDYTIHKAIDTSLRGCHLGKNYRRIMTPTKKQWKTIVEIFGKERAIDMLPIINSESQFNHSAVGYNKWGKDCGIVQIRDINGGCSMTERQQFEWLKKRIDSQSTNVGTCRSWLNNNERLVRCYYNRHNGRLSAFNSYDNKLMKQRAFYISFIK